MQDRFTDLLTEYILDQLTDEERLKVKAHLDSGCARCTTEYGMLQETIHLLPHALTGRKLRPEIKSRIDAVIDTENALERERLQGMQHISHYRLLRRLGIGAMGEVFLAEDTQLGRSTAIKLIRPEVATNTERKKRFLREARAAANLNHPGIATIYEVGEVEGTNFIAMEYVEGASLAQIIAGQPMQPERVIAIGIQLANAIGEAHRRGILHRDLKPENIQISRDDQAKILDFGLAKFKESRLEDDYTTTSARILGTIPYMSPEQIQAETLDGRSDLFSLGSILYEMTTGKSPFKSANPAETIENILDNDPPPFEAGEGLRQIILKCLQKDSANRYASAKELEADLEKVRRGETLTRPQGPGFDHDSSAISIAVLYFENLSAEKESDYFRAGMTEDIIVELSKIKSWVVRPRAQVVQYKDQEIDLSGVGAELKVTHLVNGSIRKSGNRLRISAQLVDARNAVSLWAERYDRDLKDVFEIQGEIAQKIAEALQIHLTSAERKEIRKRPTESMEAYDYYLRGREMIFRLSKDGIEAAIDYFEHALKSDPQYALAYAGLAQAYGIKLSFYGGPERLAELAIENSERALQIDGKLAQAYASLGLAFFLKGQSKEALEACAAAIQLNPYDAFASWISGRLSYRLNQYEQAVAHFRRTIELLPDFYTAYSDLSQTFENMGQVESAVETQTKTVEACKRYLQNFPNEARAHIFLATNSARLGLREEAITEGFIAVGLSPDDPVMMYNMACLYSVLNEPEASLEWLARSIRNGRRDFEWMKRDPSLDNIRNLPVYQKLVSGN
jgi:serine/threonine protein kinase/Tfp pilus assembly protein PilF